MPSNKKTAALPTAEAIEAMLAAIGQTSEPATAAQLAKLTVKPHKLTEAAVMVIVEERVARGASILGSR
jgi:hypothetical protein